MREHSDNYRYRIINARNSAIVSPDKVENDPNDEDQRVQSWRAHLDNEHFAKNEGDLWKLIQQGEYYLIHNFSTGRYLTVEDEGNEPRPHVRLTKEDNQWWALEKVSDYHLICPSDRPHQAISPGGDGDDVWLRLSDRLPGTDRGWYLRFA